MCEQRFSRPWHCAHVVPAMSISVRAKKKTRRSEKACLGANFFADWYRYFELQLAWSHVLREPQVNKLALTADYASREKMLEVGALFHTQTKAMGVLTSMIYFCTQSPAACR